MQHCSVREMMVVSPTHVVCQTALLQDVALSLIESDCDLLAVTNSCGQFCGIVTESSVVRALMANPAENSTIEPIICRHAESVRIDADINSVLPLFRSAANTAVPVVDSEGCVCGILLRRNVIENLLHRLAASGFGAARRNDFREPAAPTGSASPAGFPTKNRVLKVHSFGTKDNPDTASPRKPCFLNGEKARRLLWGAEDRL